MPRNEPEVERKKIGAPTAYRADYARIAERMCMLGATDKDLAIAFDVDISTIERWTAKHAAFRGALKVGREPADARRALVVPARRRLLVRQRQGVHASGSKEADLRAVC